MLSVSVCMLRLIITLDMKFEINSPTNKEKLTTEMIKLSIHILKISQKMFIIEWATVTFLSASLITNKYREGSLL